MNYITVDAAGVHETDTNPLLAELRHFFPGKTDEEIVAAALTTYYADPATQAVPGRINDTTMEAALVRLRMQLDAGFRRDIEMQEEYARAYGLIHREADD
jgi:hypothetical protein